MAEFKFEHGILWSRKGVTMVFRNAVIHPWEPVIWWLPNWPIGVVLYLLRKTPNPIRNVFKRKRRY